MRSWLDPFMLSLIGAVVVASVWPATGTTLEMMGRLGTIAVAILFFVHGAALSREQIRAGATHWRLHLFIVSLTFVVFPLFVLPINQLAPHWIPQDLALGFLYLGVLPSAVSSSIAYTAMARGNVPAAVCSAAASNVFGMMFTPFLLMLLVSTTGDGGFQVLDALRDIVLQLLLPFVLGHGTRKWLGAWLDRHSALAARYDQAVILLIVYIAFSESVANGLWQRLPATAIAIALLLCLLLLCVLLALITWTSRRIGFDRADEIAAVFCGSKKSLASGLPMAKVLFAANPGFGMIVLPIMCYNQIQILIGAVLAKRYLRTSPAPPL